MFLVIVFHQKIIFFEDQNHRAPVILFLKIGAPIQKILYIPRFFFFLPVTLLFIRNRNGQSMDSYRLKKNFRILFFSINGFIFQSQFAVSPYEICFSSQSIVVNLNFLFPICLSCFQFTFLCFQSKIFLMLVSNLIIA